MRRKHVPQRTCVGCRQVRDKRDLVRVIRSSTGEIEVDTSGKKAGAYLCCTRSCWEIALKERRLDHALRVRLTREEMARLQEYAQTMPVAGEREE